MEKKSLIFLFVILLILVIVIGACVIIKKSNSNDVNALEQMIEVKPQEEIKEEEVEEEEEDELIVENVDIDGKTYEVIAVLYIPTLDIEYPVLSSTSKELLKVSLNKYWGPNPNKKGNLCILGHNYNDDKFFGKLHNIQIGDYIQLTDMSQKTLQYKVYDTYIVNPDNTDCTSQLTNGETEITLITCTKNFKQRFIVKARAEKPKKQKMEIKV